MLKITLYLLSTLTKFGSEKLFDKFIYSPSFLKNLRYGHKSGKSLRRAKVLTKLLEKMFAYDLSDYKGYTIAISHLDAAWKWTAIDSKIRAYKTFYKGIEHIHRYPYFSISLTSPQYFEWIKKYDDKLGRVSENLSLWEETKAMVAKGKIDACGGMWLEPDLNIPSGEALIRQRLYGQLYYLRNFGKISTVETVLDVFGYCNTLPQILLKTGADSFWTTKLTWNDSNLFPFANYMWRGVDGSEIFTHMYKFNLFSLIDWGVYKWTARRPIEKGLVFNSHNLMDCENKPMFNISGMNIRTTDFSGLDELKDKVSDDYVKTLGMFYGQGDGGKGPLEMEILFAENLGHLFGYKHTTTHSYFDILKKDVGDNLVIWDDEMYLELHRGCLTTQVKVKQGNRFSESLTIAAENLSTLALLGTLINNNKYPKQLFDDCWQKIMFNQFHDILPGSSVAEVYPLTWKEHDFVINKMKSLLNDTVTEIYERLPDNEEKILIYNPVSVMNEAIIPIGDSELILNNLKSLSFTVIDKNELIKASESEEEDLKVTENDSVLIIENDSLRVLISKDDGNLKGLQMNGGKSGKKPSENIGNMLYGERNGYTDYPIPTNVEIDNLNPKILKMRGARLRVYHENFEGAEYPAWDLDKEYKLKEESIIPLEKITIQNDRNMISVNVSYKFLNSTAEVKYILRSRSDKLDIKLDIDLKDPKVLIKYFIPLNIKSDDVVAETPFGSISRKRIPKTNMEKAKWEFSMHKWLDIADEDVGITILNEDRYGASADAKGAGITLVRSPPYPVSPFHTCQQIFEEGEKPEFTDIMKHNFNLAILPHVGSWKEHNIPARALAFNNKSIVIQKSKKSDSKTKLTENDLFTIPAEKSEQSIDIKILKTPRIETNAENVILSVLKPGEWMDIDHAHEMELIKSEKGYIGENYYLPEEPSVWTWDKRTIILRVYESIGQKTSTEINILYAIEANRIETIEEIDMLEWKKYADVDFKAIDNIKNSILIETELNPYEIKTFKISLKK